MFLQGRQPGGDRPRRRTGDHDFRQSDHGHSFAKAGRLRALAVTSAKRSAALPDLPTMAEAGVPGFEAATWNGLLAPAGTPREIVARLNADIVKVLKMPETRDKLAANALEPIADSSDAFERTSRPKSSAGAKS